MALDPHDRAARRLRGYEFESVVPWAEIFDLEEP